MTNTNGLDLPDAQPYLLHEVDRGEEVCGVVPEQAMSAIAERDRRVPALWISQGAPKLGWCRHHGPSHSPNRAAARFHRCC
jgi:hypothetical protein